MSEGKVFGLPAHGDLGVCLVCGENFIKLMTRAFMKNEQPEVQHTEMSGIGKFAMHDECAEKLQVVKGGGGKLSEYPDGPLKKILTKAAKGKRRGHI